MKCDWAATRRSEQDLELTPERCFKAEELLQQLLRFNDLESQSSCDNHQGKILRQLTQLLIEDIDLIDKQVGAYAKRLTCFIDEAAYAGDRGRGLQLGRRQQKAEVKSKVPSGKKLESEHTISHLQEPLLCPNDIGPLTKWNPHHSDSSAEFDTVSHFEEGKAPVTEIDQLRLRIQSNLNGIQAILARLRDHGICSEETRQIELRLKHFTMSDYPSTLKKRVSQPFGESKGVLPATLDSVSVRDQSVPKFEHYKTHLLTTCAIASLDLLVFLAIRLYDISYSPEQILMLIPAFRFTFAICAVLGAAGLAFSLFEIYGVDYRYSLQIPLECHLTSFDLLQVAQVQFAIWSFGVAAYFFDLKTAHVLLESRHYYYPIFIICGQIAVFWLPMARRLRSNLNRLKLSMWHCIKTGCWLESKVTFADNVLGDVLTSLPKPFTDMAFVVAVIVKVAITRQVTQHVYGSDWLEELCVALITAIPFVIRFNQCMTRFRTECSPQREVQLANAGKYTSTLALIVVSLLPWNAFNITYFESKILFVSMCLIASIYNLVWDFFFDWDLTFSWLNGIRPRHAALYPRHMYSMIATYNFFARMTWILTLIPFNFAEDPRLNKNATLFFISIIEILRRGLWLTLRLENEQVTNFSKYDQSQGLCSFQ